MIFAVASAVAISFLIIAVVLFYIIVLIMVMEYCNHNYHKIDEDVEADGFELDDKTIDDEIKEHYRDIGGEG